jgi:hypothetical protein
MLDTLGYGELTARRPFFYHFLWRTDDAKLDSVLTHGLERVDSHWDGLWRSRPNHVYIGDMSRIRAIFTQGCRATKQPWDLLRVDTSLLERHRFNADEDHFTTGDYPELSKNRVNDKHACQYFHKPFPPTQWIYDWGKYLRFPIPSLGEWADAVGLGDDPAEVRYSMSKGSVAYRGVIPPKALSLVRKTRDLDGTKD